MEGKISFPLKWDKLTAAVAYLTERSRHDDHFGFPKLVKLLYYADCAAYIRTGQPITDVTYVHMPHGPYPDDWTAMLKRLEDEQAIKTLKEYAPKGYWTHRPAASDAAAAAALTEKERSFLDEQLRQFADFSAAEIEEYSHDELAWGATAQGEVMPYELCGIRMPGPVTDDVRQRAQRIAEDIRSNGRQVSRILVERRDAV
ncbi:MAG: Panacea domain-containing protein [Chloroflexota bacterium]|nr:Panacea domain-containing protein [Chloroflexota bacterium]MDE2960846.1 Panacea domain-containing protein [Chloroflexota bacterium]